MKYGKKWPIYAEQWDDMVINPSRVAEFEKYARNAIKHKATYLDIEEDTGVPWPMIAVLHLRESNADFSTYLGNGQPLNRVTTIVPKGRGPFSSFKEGAIDALHIDGLADVIDWRLEKILWYGEKFNGLGYEMKGLASPYVWGGTNQQERGKYISDHNFDPNVMDTQPGMAPILKTIAKLDPTVRFVRETPMGVEPPPKEEPVDEVAELRQMVAALAKQMAELADIIADAGIGKPKPVPSPVPLPPPPDTPVIPVADPSTSQRAADLRVGILSIITAVLGPMLGVTGTVDSGTVSGAIGPIGVIASALGLPGFLTPLLSKMAKGLLKGMSG